MVRKMFDEFIEKARGQTFNCQINRCIKKLLFELAEYSINDWLVDRVKKRAKKQ